MLLIELTLCLWYVFSIIIIYLFDWNLIGIIPIIIAVKSIKDHNYQYRNLLQPDIAAYLILCHGLVALGFTIHLIDHL